MTALVCAIIGCKSKEEIELEKQKLEVEKMQLELQKTILEAATGQQTAKAKEVLPVMKTYYTLESAYFMETNKISKTFEEVGFIPPSRKSAYIYEKIENGISATLVEKVGECQAGSKWTMTAKIVNNDIEFTKKVENPTCAYLTPDFK